MVLSRGENRNIKEGNQRWPRQIAIMQFNSTLIGGLGQKMQRKADCLEVLRVIAAMIFVDILAQEDKKIWVWEENRENLFRSRGGRWTQSTRNKT